MKAIFTGQFLFLLLSLGASWVPVSAQVGTSKRVLGPFVSDGCSVPNKIIPDTFTNCCVQHDYAYWVGGNRTQKEKADKDLITCIQQRNASDVTAEVWGKTLANFADDRWGASWKPKRYPPFAELTAEEKAEVARKTKLIEENNCFKFDSYDRPNSSGKKKTKTVHIRTRSIPIVKNYDSEEKCTMGLQRTVELNTTLKATKALTCYSLETKGYDDGTEYTIIYSPECEAGYFIFEDRKDAPQAPYFLFEGCGACESKVKKSSFVEKYRLRMEPIQSMEYSEEGNR